MLIGKLVRLRAIDVKKDTDLFTEWMNDYEVAKFMGGAFMPMSKEKERKELQRFMNDERVRIFAVETLTGGNLIGSISLMQVSHIDGTATTGTLIGDKRYWRKGFATDAKMVLLHYAFSVLNLRRISTRIVAENIGSIRCQEKCGYVREGIWKKELYTEGRYRDMVLLAVFRKGWMGRWHAYMGHKKQAR
ncbi:MAG: hypothetical protein A3I44_04655 [Candidatus Sungbacteria bacterium RIFCSPLOWO2_02_FULL_51_17]|uniref:N-acetyltransferase domain-containing protein n=1 Tax=Candidatus Sungbacteria bacterium RIFCSPHIGHO2_02_FULL_51_29 TaxID=1802273 RepID=A0A1G2KY76_9BACT|nr:MAG: hypothetical protein A2676_05380 [Candidatus Sungbacteria bacterium RIFCSPHIGHO2_01_FULL_51_22]OHA03431.1 MAG: hypothetical protein A3C16_00110 [Candidatus Sungbacteria bacterium RIFCSPHIGHO2_02_FULL_51_29]OHA07906.1 MAG: hypothetical protein A3B29_04980 [Candidatus Sungbacteria bacterium RIFCSPLOWO2_01_FULL_51_34]OHA12460.1 MAG: hypothetical protein A3I44_04655 [Candidatus Sungbacteria bacterium RIFCSPLOWO2_02_FULL_51_17]